MFTLADATKYLLAEVKDVKVIGFWRQGPNYILHVDTGNRKFDCNNYIVTPTGSVRMTNPILSDLNPSAMTSVRRS